VWGGTLLDDVSRTGAEYVIERAGEPAAAIIPIHIYEQQITDRADRFNRIEALRQHLTQNATVGDLEEAIDGATQSVRKRRK